MKHRVCLPFILGATLLLSCMALAQVPNIIHYQGRVAVSGTPFNGLGSFKFALLDEAGITTYWSNDGTSVNGSEPVNAVQLNVSKGLFRVSLGKTSLENMAPISDDVVAKNAKLRVWFNSGSNGWQRLQPDQEYSPSSFASKSDKLSSKPFKYTVMSFGSNTLPLAPTWNTGISVRYNLTADTKQVTEISANHTSGNANIHVVYTGSPRKPNGRITLKRRSSDGVEVDLAVLNLTTVGDNISTAINSNVLLDWENYNYFIDAQVDSGNYDAFNQNGAGNLSFIRLNKVSLTESR